MVFNHFLIFLFLLLACQPLLAQIYDVVGSQNPPDIKWKYIDTVHYRVIFPEELAKDAQRVANTAEYVYEPVSMTLGVKPKRIPLILTSDSVISNGYVALAPRRTEWWSPSPQSPLAGTGDWYNLLASHELRHVAQFDKMNSGFTGIAGLLFGETGLQLASMISVPMWFWEGDAVTTETALSDAGRGRMPEFDMEIRSLLLSGVRYSYYKAYLGSFKDWYPDYYHLGYLLAANVRRNNGADVWSRVLDQTSMYSFYPFAFSSSLKKITGKNTTETYESTMSEIGYKWIDQLEGIALTDAEPKNTQGREGWSSYVSPRYASDGSIIAYKIGMSDPAKLIRLNENIEEDIMQFYPLDPSISVGDDKVVWNEPRFDIRWIARSYTDIRLYDLKNRKARNVKTKSKLFAPSLSPDGKKIAAVEFLPDRRCSLVIVDSDTGDEISRFGNPDNDFIKLPTWSKDGRQIAFIRQKMSGVTLAVVNIETGEVKDIIKNTLESIYSPAFYKNYLLYQSPYSGIDNIYAVDMNTYQRYQVTSRRFGAFSPAVSPDGSKLAFSDYTTDGYKIVEMPLDPSKWKNIGEIEDRSIRYYEPLISQEQGGNIFKNGDIPDHQYQVKGYSPIAHAFNLHSWSLLPFPPDLGFSLISTDLLNTMKSSAGLEYNTNEKVGSVFLKLTYAGLFPVLDTSIRYGGRASTLDKSDIEYYSWHETGLGFGTRLPLNFSKGAYTSSLNIGSIIEWRRISRQTYHEEFELGNGDFLPIKYQLSYDRLIYSSIRDIYPRWGQSLNLTYQHIPFRSDYIGSKLYAEATLLFPGLFRHHSLKVQAGYEGQNPENYRFSSELEFPRGYDYEFQNKIYKASINYTMPLLYPDFDIGAFFYLKRVRANLFYDYALGKDGKDKNVSSSSFIKRDYQSAGLELLLDSHFFTFIVPVDFGFRCSYKIKEKEVVIQGMLFGSAF